MISSSILSIALLAIVCLVRSSDAFSLHRTRARNAIPQIPRKLHPSTIIPSSSSHQSSIRRIPRDESGGTGGRTSIVPFAKKDDNNNAEEKENYTRVEDGSPLGVAIVFLGSLFLFSSGDESYKDPTSDSVWIVFATASAAAGLARLYRYSTREKDE